MRKTSSDLGKCLAILAALGPRMFAQAFATEIVPAPVVVVQEYKARVEEGMQRARRVSQSSDDTTQERVSRLSAALISTERGTLRRIAAENDESREFYIELYWNPQAPKKVLIQPLAVFYRGSGPRSGVDHVDDRGYRMTLDSADLEDFGFHAGGGLYDDRPFLGKKVGESELIAAFNRALRAARAAMGLERRRLYFSKKSERVGGALDALSKELAAPGERP